MIDLTGARILITGGAGFVGSFVIDQLLEESIAEIIIIDNLCRGSLRNINTALKDPRVKFIENDILNQEMLDEQFKGIDYCFHLAALRITHCASDPDLSFKVMHEGTFHVIQSCIKHNIKKLFFASSASIYGQADSFPTSESHHPYNNQTLYGAAKMANELMLRSFHHMSGLDYTATRYFNIYGPNMDIHGKYTEVLIRWYNLIKEGKPPIIFGEGDQTMDFIYVEDIARASIAALKADTTDQVYNIAMGKETSLKELCYALLETMNSDLKPEFIAVPESREKVEVMRRLADVSKARNEINFEAQVDLKQGLALLVEWLDQQNITQS